MVCASVHGIPGDCLVDTGLQTDTFLLLQTGPSVDSFPSSCDLLSARLWLSPALAFSAHHIHMWGLAKMTATLLALGLGY